jgi:hypothetical protein
MSRLETDIRRRSELRKFMKQDLDSLLEAESKQQAAQMAARAIHWHVMTNRVSAGNIRGR